MLNRRFKQGRRIREYQLEEETVSLPIALILGLGMGTDEASSRNSGLCLARHVKERLKK